MLQCFIRACRRHRLVFSTVASWCGSDARQYIASAPEQHRRNQSIDLIGVIRVNVLLATYRPAKGLPIPLRLREKESNIQKGEEKKLRELERQRGDGPLKLPRVCGGGED